MPGTDPRTNRLEALLDEVVHVPDPDARLRKIREARTGVDQLERELRAAARDAILELRSETPPKTWDSIGELLGVSAQRAEQLSRT